jgi:PAS domain-containing protein
MQGRTGEWEGFMNGRDDKQNRQTGEKIAELINRAGVGVFAIDQRTGSITDANQATLDIFGMTSCKGVSVFDTYADPKEREEAAWLKPPRKGRRDPRTSAAPPGPYGRGLLHVGPMGLGKVGRPCQALVGELRRPLGPVYNSPRP